MDNNSMGFDKDKNFMNNPEHNVITLERWLEEEHTTEEKEAIVLKIDSSLRVYHEYSCNIESFDPKDITTDLDEDDDDDNSVYFLVYSKDEDTSEYVAKNIHDAGILAFSIYMDRDLRGHEDFLKMNFDEFIKFIPEGQGPYYRGVIMRNAPVYLNEFIEEKAKRELEKYKDVTKSLENPYGNAAYIRNLLQPMILVIVGFVIIVIALILHFV